MATDPLVIFGKVEIYEKRVGKQRLITDGKCAVILAEKPSKGAKEWTTDKGSRRFVEKGAPKSARDATADFFARLAASVTKCEVCDGTGFRKCEHCGGDGALSCRMKGCAVRHACDQCRLGNAKCAKCDGVHFTAEATVAIDDLGKIPLKHARALSWWLARGAGGRVWTTKELYGKGAEQHALVFKRGDEGFIVGEYADRRPPDVTVKL